MKRSIEVGCQLNEKRSIEVGYLTCRVSVCVWSVCVVVLSSTGSGLESSTRRTPLGKARSLDKARTPL